MTSPNTTPKQLDYRDGLPYPDAILDESQQVIILNLHEPFSDYVTKNMFAQVLNHRPDGAITDEQSERSRRFWGAINAGMMVTDKAVQFDRARLLELPDDLYSLVREPTRVSWARLKAWNLPPEAVIGAFQLEPSQVSDSEIVIIPPHRNPLEPYVEASQKILGKTPHFLQYTEIYYGGGFPWKLTEYQPGLRNFIGEVSGAL